MACFCEFCFCLGPVIIGVRKQNPTAITAEEPDATTSPDDIDHLDAASLGGFIGYTTIHGTDVSTTDEHSPGN